MTHFRVALILTAWLCGLASPTPAQDLRAAANAAVARDKTDGEDAQVRRAALAALGATPGAVVVMNPANGRVYALVNQDWAARRAFQPCSTIKLVTGLAALNEGGVASASAARGTMSFSQALAASDNDFFAGLGAEIGAARLVRYARDLGLGQRTGLNLSGEAAGRLPGGAGDARQMSSYGAGFAVTPLQLAALVSAVANGGKLVRPQLGASGVGRRRLNLISASSLRQMLPGLAGAVQRGTARPAYDSSNRVLGKTGTCDTADGALGWFVSFAPVAPPKLVVVVLTRGAGADGAEAAAVAGRLYRALKPRFGGSNGWVAGLPTYDQAVAASRPRKRQTANR